MELKIHMSNNKCKVALKSTTHTLIALMKLKNIVIIVVYKNNLLVHMYPV